MDPTRFDQFAKALGRARSRRSVLAALGAALGAIGRSGSALPAGAAAVQGTPAATPLLAANNATSFVQTATGGSFRPNPLAGAATPGPGTPTSARPGAYLLTLTGHNGETVAFADRPSRDFADVPTSRFFSGLGFLPDNPPNAALVTDLPGQPDAVILIELLNPAYEAATRTLTYEANLLHQYPNARSDALAPLVTRAQQESAPTAAVTFGATSLFIDDCPDSTEECWTVGQNGVCGDMGSITNGNCWSWATWTCNPCGSYAGTCNSTYAACNSSCLDDIALCGNPGCCNGQCCPNPPCFGTTPQSFYCPPSDYCTAQCPGS